MERNVETNAFIYRKDGDRNRDSGFSAMLHAGPATLAGHGPRSSGRTGLHCSTVQNRSTIEIKAVMNSDQKNSHRHSNQELLVC